MQPKIVTVIGYVLCLALTYLLMGCTTMARQWRVHPDDMAQFKTDQVKCQRFALGSGRYTEAMFNDCLSAAGYQSEIVSQ